MQTVSSTQVSTFDKCNRQWSFTELFKLPKPKRHELTLGSGLHACAERYLWAPDGKVPKHEHFEPGMALCGQIPGDPIQVFPNTPGRFSDSQGNRWWEVRDRDGTWAELNIDDRQKVRDWIEKGIAEKVLAHLPGGIPELKFRLPLIEGVEYESIIDYHSVEFARIEDHKTYSGSYKQSPSSLARDKQILSYGKWMAVQRPETERFTLVHNQFSKKDGRVGRTFASEVNDYPYVSRDAVERNWASMQAQARTMRDLASEFGEGDVDRWAEIPGAPLGSDTCRNNYGKPCIFLDICSHRKTPTAWLDYSAQSAKVVSQGRAFEHHLLTRTSTTTKTSPDMSPLPPLRQPGSPAPLPASKKPELLSQGEQGDYRYNTYSLPQVGGVRTVALVPWRNPRCASCSGVGLNAALTPCNQCCTWTADPTKQEGEDRSGDLPTHWRIGFDDSGTWFCKEIAEAAVEPVASKEPEYAPVEPVEAPAEAAPVRRGPGRPPGAKAKAKATLKPETVTTAAAGRVDVTVSDNRRPENGFTLVLGSSCSGADYYSLTQIVAQIRGEMGEKVGSSYWAKDTWKRKDELVQCADNIVESIGPGATLVCETPDLDMGQLVSALEARAIDGGGRVIRAVAR